MAPATNHLTDGLSALDPSLEHRLPRSAIGASRLVGAGEGHESKFGIPHRPTESPEAQITPRLLVLAMLVEQERVIPH